jgi:hypothetical protein
LNLEMAISSIFSLRFKSTMVKDHGQIVLSLNEYRFVTNSRDSTHIPSTTNALV